ncbi:MAG: methyltransferase domain-containing protein [Phycisphaerae bacterium]|nr:methyltransferase domain-containing protein [Phycisphaerae bacterium]
MRKNKGFTEKPKSLLKNMVREIFARARTAVGTISARADVKAYIKSGRKPWSRGYNLSKFDFITSVLNNDELMAKFRAQQVLPDGYGYGYDERVVEYPWTLSRLSVDSGKFLDAGSVFNFREIVEHPKFSGKRMTIFTLAPESRAFWQKGISYHYGDLRQVPFRDNWFDEICTISTLGHIGMDNRIYTKKEGSGQIGLEAEKAVKELIRVLQPGGKILASVVFGKHQLIDWNGSPFAEQFDSVLLKSLLNVFSSCSSISTSFYIYTKNGWNISTEEECQGVEYFNIHTAASFDPDNAAAARSVALIEVVK